ncbi:glycosyltransferase family 4 protein [Reinekea thalattae]|uniref:Glycosyltransferase family 4 protein n=1 Tax=Reinekea thalattae TaxID=2593301 RepID=A0A5C8Z5K2_9GAMM|nr:glycosyltransferase family 4 protein [Reinekea thalattae]TXR52186.1 glycosyltransferase family 4 protein [Reinekea thalattae]
MVDRSNNECEIILGNSNKKFSGVTSTMLQVLSVQKESADIAVLGQYHLPDDINALNFFQALKVCRRPLSSGLPRVFHARRNDEMIQGLLLKVLSPTAIRLVFTSTAQRQKTWITRWLMSKMDGLLTTCSAAHQFMLEPADAVIPHGINIGRMVEQQPTKEHDLPGKYNVGIFGRVRHQKGIDLFVDALLEVLPNQPDWAGVVVGEITAQNETFVSGLKKKIDKAGLGDRIRFYGEVDFQDIPWFYRSMDIVTSLSRNEGFGLTVPEAMSVAKPVIATRAGAWPDIIEQDVDGLLIDVADVDALVRGLNDYMASPEKRESTGFKAQEKVQQLYTIDREAQALLSYYRQLQNS